MFGFRIVEDVRMVDPVLGPDGLQIIDWSRCRSIPRAMRRARRGKPQRCRPVTKPKDEVLRIGRHMLVMHPAIAARMRAELDAP